MQFNPGDIILHSSHKQNREAVIVSVEKGGNALRVAPTTSSQRVYWIMVYQVLGVIQKASASSELPPPASSPFPSTE